MESWITGGSPGDHRKRGYYYTGNLPGTPSRGCYGLVYGRLWIGLDVADDACYDAVEVMYMTEWLTVSEASRQLDIAERTVRHWITKDKLSAKKESGRWLIDPESIRPVGNDVAESSASPAKQTTIAVPLERYEGLITRVAQLEAENQEYRLMLEDQRRSWWRRWFRRKTED